MRRTATAALVLVPLLAAAVQTSALPFIVLHGRILLSSPLPGSNKLDNSGYYMILSILLTD
jgi:hypothetical protein